jgi:Golgi phosphoprotein 3 (GPP34)
MTSVALADELLLLAYNDETGRCSVPLIALDLGMAAAILVDLAMRGRVEVVDAAVVPKDLSPIGHPVIDEILSRIGAERPQPAAFWLQRLRHNLRQHVLDGLVAQGVVRDQDDTGWDILRVHHYPAVDPTVEREARRRLTAALAGDSAPDERTAALAALISAARMQATLGLTGDGATEAYQRLAAIAEQAGFAPGGAVQNATVRPSVAFLFGVLYRAVGTALGPVKR